MKNLEKHYVILPNLQRFRSWALENIAEEWHGYGGHRAILTETKEYRPVIHLRHLRGVKITPGTIHWADDWFMGMTPRAAQEMESYVEFLLAVHTEGKELDGRGHAKKKPKDPKKDKANAGRPE